MIGNRVGKRVRWGIWMLLASALCHVSDAAQAPANTTILLQKGWRFALHEGLGPEKPGFDHAGWSTVHVPHNGREISDETPRSTRRVWFQKQFPFDRPETAHRVVLDVFQSRSVEVWINGQAVENTSDSAETFTADITDEVRAGNNLLAIRTSVPGIQGGVRLHLHGPVHLKRDGIRIDTPNWRGGPTPIRIGMTIRNQAHDGWPVEVTAVLHGPDGELLAHAQTGRQTVPAEGSLAVEMTTSPITDPPLWSPEAPQLCRVVVSLHSGDTLIETRETTFGFRWFRFDAERGFFLNGQPLKLRGVVYAKIGPLRTEDRQQLWDYEMRLLKEMGLNFVRPSRMIDESFLSACDRAGLLATVQIPVMQSIDEVDPVVRNVVHRLGPHPSIITWHFNGEGKDARVAALHSATAKALRRADPTRPVLCVELGWRAPGSVGLIDADVAGQGNYTGWYEGTLDHIGPYMDAYRDLLQERYGRPLPIIISNYGAAADAQVHSNAPRRNDYSHEYLTRFHERFEREISRRPWIAGGLIFTFRDLQSAQPIPRHTWKGMIDLEENKKDAYYFYQSVWSSEPFVHIEQKSWKRRDLWPANADVPVRVLSNCDDVELRLNGEPVTSRARAPDGSWLVRFRSGRNELRALGIKGARQVEDTATIDIRYRPPAPEVRLISGETPSLTELSLTWNRIPGADSYRIYRGEHPDFTPEADRLFGTTEKESIAVQRFSDGSYYRVAAVSGDTAGVPSPVVGSVPGALRWRFATDGWVMSSPALADINGDGNLEILFGSYDGRVYALNDQGQMLWSFETSDPVFSSPAVAELRPDDGMSIVIASSRALYVLDSSGRQRWTHAGVRQFDRNDKSPALGDVDGDGQLEIAVASDTGELLLFNAGGTLRWKFSTAADANRGLSLTTPMFVGDAEEKGASILFSADDGGTWLVNADGELRWRYDNQLGDAVPGLPPNFHHLTPAAGAVVEGGPTRILVGAGHLKSLDLEGHLVWERKDRSGTPQISELSNDGAQSIVLTARRELHVLSSDGSDAWSFTLEHPRDYFLQPPVCADISGDGVGDLIAGSRATRLYAIGARGQLLWDFRTDDEITGTAAVADIDRDGRTEVIFGSRDGYLRVLGGGEVSKSFYPSRQYRGGVSRRAAYPQ